MLVLGFVSRELAILLAWQLIVTRDISFKGWYWTHSCISIVVILTNTDRVANLQIRVLMVCCHFGATNLVTLVRRLDLVQNGHFLLNYNVHTW